MPIRTLAAFGPTPLPTWRRPPSAVLGPVVLTLCAAALWAVSLGQIEIGQVTDIGLISVLPAPFFAALGVLTAGFCLSLRQERGRVPLLLLHVGVLIVMLYGAPALIEEMPRFHSVWKHLGVVDYIQRTGQVNPRIDAYFNWPGLFILFAFVSDAAGIQNWRDLVAWTPVVLNLLQLGPLLLIFGSATDDKRLVWLAVWFFYLANWVGQDYFSPQGFNYLLHLAILGILVAWFRVPAGERHPLLARLGVPDLFARLPERIRRFAPTDLPPPAISPWQRRGLLLVVLALYFVTVASHQLTPFATLGSVIALVVFNRSTARLLPFIMTVMVVLWIQFMAETYMAGHGSTLVSQMGDLDSAVNENTTTRLGGSQGHLIVVYARSLMTLGLWGLAAIGGLRRLRHGHRDLTYVLLATAPFPLVILQPYGGEMLLRVYLFTLPFMAFFAAALFFPDRAAGTSRWTTVLVGALSVALLGAFFVTRYGNERMDYAAPQEVAAAEHLYNIAPPGSLLLVGTTNTPIRFRDYEKYRTRSLTSQLVWRGDAPIGRNLEAVAAVMNNPRVPATYLFITRSQIANDELFGLYPIPLEELAREMAASDLFTVVYANEHATIYALKEPPSEAAP
jgi:hypothetical protein